MTPEILRQGPPPPRPQTSAAHGTSPRAVKGRPPPVDILKVDDPRANDETGGPRAQDRALETLLGQDPQAWVLALGDDGFRVPLPARAELNGLRTVPPPPDRATMVDLVVPEDQMVVVLTWERARRLGSAVALVHTLADPATSTTLAILDLRHRFGVWLGLLAKVDPSPIADEEATDGLARGALFVPRRPRTATMTTNGHAVILEVDDRVERMLGWRPEQMVGMRSLDFVHPVDHPRVIAAWLEMLSTRNSNRVRSRYRCQDGTWLWIESEGVLEDVPDLEGARVIRHMTDISDEMAAHEEVRHREELFRRLAESLPAGLAQIRPDRSVVYANSRLSSVLGTPDEGGLDARFTRLVDTDRARFAQALAEVLTDEVDRRLEVRVLTGDDGITTTCLVTLVALAEHNAPAGALVTVEDITESAHLREQLRIRATLDPLTGCHNRSSIMVRLERSLRDGMGTAVVFVDLDHFKKVNDAYGHAAGDELLVQAARCLSAGTRADDTVGRIGGDEFLVVCRGVDDSDQALAVARRLADGLRVEVDLPGEPGTDPRRVALHGSVGVALAAPGITADELIAHADAAMYRSKRQGDGRPVLYEAS